MTLFNQTDINMKHPFCNQVKRVLLTTLVAISVVSVSVTAQESPYEKGQRQLDNNDYQAAQRTFESLLQADEGKQDAALYWLAYAQFKNNRSQAALKTIKTLTENHSKSPWWDDALALRVEIQDKSGTSIDIDDEEMKLYALNSLMNAPSERSLAILRKLLDGNNSEQVKSRALFVLSQLSVPDAFELIASLANDNSNAKLQQEAIHVLGISGSKQALSLLMEIYQRTDDPEIKDSILQSYLVADESSELVRLAKSEPDPELKKKAIQLLGAMSQSDSLLQLYDDPDFKNYRDELLTGMAIGDGVEALHSVIKREQDEELLVEAVERLGIISTSRSGDLLQDIYKDKNNRAVRDAVLKAMFMQSDAQGLIAIVKNESDPELKRNALQKLSMMGSDDAIDFFSDVLDNEGQ